MKTRKTPVIDSEPAWKKRRRENAVQSRKKKFWTIIGVAGAVVVVGFMIFMMVRGGLSSGADNEKTEHHLGIARVIEKNEIKDKSGKITGREIVFKVARGEARKRVNQETFDSLQMNDEVLLTFDVDKFSGLPSKAIKWEPIKPAAPEPDKK
ncbi:MAG TPA: hypothetical protein PLU88_00315 [Armatimonadota bacterium]|nr:hypothetical protein [Armatimonadota bacterium]HOM72166.1 hypothetical protein [Armatimonadota bacterium]HOP80475.1 hypothetical protein [Armatimonadota bacterium]HPP73557.1 hypothetical protein [Armatimonadota bacterium]